MFCFSLLLFTVVTEMPKLMKSNCQTATDVSWPYKRDDKKNHKQRRSRIYTHHHGCPAHTAAVFLSCLVSLIRSELLIIERIASEWDSIIDRVDCSLLKGAGR